MNGRLGRYKDLAWFVAKYGRADFVSKALHGEEAGSADPAGAEAFARDLESLGPTFIKLGQLLSTRADLLPPAYLEALARLQDNVEPFPYEDVERTIREELGVRVSHAFVEFDRLPIAAASLGQVHRAVLRGGREVAVKVQRPGIHELIEKDLAAFHEIAKVIDRVGAARNVDATRVLEEFRRTLLSELDYREEARNLVTVAHQLRDFDNIVVPLPVDDFTTARVLTMDYVCGAKITAISRVEWTEVDGAALAEELFQAYLQQILIDGVFHADPHPGNVLLTPDRRVALIDLGMVGRISPPIQEQLFKLILAISEGRGDEAADVLMCLGERREDFHEADMRRAIADLVGRFHRLTMREMNVGRVVIETSRSAAEHGLKMPPELALLGKTLLHLDEVGRVLDPEFDVNASLRRNATSVMRRRMMKSATPANLFSAAMDVREFAERLPGRVNKILDSLAASDLRFKVEVIDQGSIIEGLQKVANRIALGLVLAALIVGAAMLMRVPTSLTIFGYPWIAMLLFLAAAAGGFWMAWTILAGDVRKTRVR
ncbi:MAG TPA: AarF/UbiB family protein [Vicinamibacterales bacterium]|jgi:predicted unusual protein kinase regulating ubiquinone biosynthesis (AarF/ABC1/UbiB family)|nr:AarF/UbiB family protein [Vicinamibacterales bacterium]